jgi:hypothetical protein
MSVVGEVSGYWSPTEHRNVPVLSMTLSLHVQAVPVPPLPHAKQVVAVGGTPLIVSIHVAPACSGEPHEGSTVNPPSVDGHCHPPMTMEHIPALVAPPPAQAGKSEPMLPSSRQPVGIHIRMYGS